VSAEHSRREFVVGALAAAGGLILFAGQQNAVAALSSTQPELLVFDPEHADACRAVADNAAAQECTTRAVVGDRVRFAMELLSAPNAPLVVAGLTSYADFILLSGCAAEHGYRVVSETARGPLTSWKVVRRRTTYSG